MISPEKWQLDREFTTVMRRLHWFQRHAAHGTLLSPRRRAALELAHQGEVAAAELIRQLGLGLQVCPTTHNCPFDLWVSNAQGQAARVEVKTSLWWHNPKSKIQNPKSNGRYQANLRQHRDVDLVIFMAKNGTWWPYIIPIQAIGKRRNIAIWSECPGDYKGQWRIYLEAWQHLEQIITNSQPRSWQLSLFYS